MPCFGDDHQLFVMYFMGERNVKFMCHIIKRDNPLSPSLYDLKRFALPGYAAPSLKFACYLSHNYKQTANYF